MKKNPSYRNEWHRTNAPTIPEREESKWKGRAREFLRKTNLQDSHTHTGTGTNVIASKRREAKQKNVIKSAWYCLCCLLNHNWPAAGIYGSARSTTRVRERETFFLFSGLFVLFLVCFYFGLKLCRPDKKRMRILLICWMAIYCLCKKTKRAVWGCVSYWKKNAFPSTRSQRKNMHLLAASMCLSNAHQQSLYYCLLIYENEHRYGTTCVCVCVLHVLSIGYKWMQVNVSVFYCRKISSALQTDANWM